MEIKDLETLKKISRRWEETFDTRCSEINQQIGIDGTKVIIKFKFREINEYYSMYLIIKNSEFSVIIDKTDNNGNVLHTQIAFYQEYSSIDDTVNICKRITASVFNVIYQFIDTDQIPGLVDWAKLASSPLGSVIDVIKDYAEKNLNA